MSSGVPGKYSCFSIPFHIILWWSANRRKGSFPGETPTVSREPFSPPHVSGGLDIPLLVDLKAWNDDDHVIAVFRERNYWGAVAKSNFTTLRFREPVYRSLRELAMSYFDFYFNTIGQKTLRAYSRPLRLVRFDGRNWMETDEDLEYIGDAFEKLTYFPLLDEDQAAALSPVAKDLLEAGLIGSNPAGLYVPEE